MADEVQRVIGIERLQHLWSLHDLMQAQQAQNGKPDQHDGAEQQTDAGGAEALQQEQASQHADGHRQHIAFHRR